MKPSSDDCCAVLELRQYTLREGQRDVLVSLFEREFIESQEARGARLVGQFRDAERPERFVWLRGFADMGAREVALKSFYGSPVWKAHREAANATMVDSSNVLLLKPLPGRRGFPAPTQARPGVEAREVPGSLVVATILHRDAPVDAAFLEYVEEQCIPELTKAGAAPLAVFQSEHATNTFPALPVREGAHVVVFFTRFASREAYRAHLEKLEGARGWKETVRPGLRARLKAEPETLLLEPTARSRLK
ncbi:NIPSNAP family protein [Myxococcus sp. K38C18041901]|uniref:NIPSNAP family protein n=1 Tax=Myxococcus guangdongensis TaxID=2906760 RepID=UPI0020A7AC53|nr:NIPSNAP family protein [Myxococcus guangdongensis]MCP3065092.1 NIPSNAP family protein [Myxococcus guangdongensis]